MGISFSPNLLDYPNLPNNGILLYLQWFIKCRYPILGPLAFGTTPTEFVIGVQCTPCRKLIEKRVSQKQWF